MSKSDWAFFFTYLAWETFRMTSRYWGNIPLILSGIALAIIVFVVMKFLTNLLGKAVKRFKNSCWFRTRCFKQNIKKMRYLDMSDPLWYVKDLNEDEIHDLISENKFLVLAQHWCYFSSLCIGTCDSLSDCIASIMRFKKEFADSDDFAINLYLGNDDFFFVYSDGKVRPVSDNLKVLKKYYKDIPEEELERIFKRAQVLTDLE